MEWWMYPFFHPPSPGSLIFCQHKRWRVAHGNKEAEREVILLAAYRSNNLWSFWVLMYAEGSTAQCFKVNTEVLFSSTHSWKSRVPQSLKAPVSVCRSVCMCVQMSVCSGVPFLAAYTHLSKGPSVLWTGKRNVIPPQTVENSKPRQPLFSPSSGLS